MLRNVLCVTAVALFSGAIVSVLCVVCFKNDAGGALVVGSSISSFEAKDINGSDVTIDFQDDEGRETVLYVFNPRCPRSGQNLSNLKELVSQKGRVFRFIGVVADRKGLSDYVKDKDLEFPVITDLSEDVRRYLKLDDTPQTIVVSDTSKVVHLWNGPYSGDQEKEIEAFFGLSLPGAETADGRGAFK